MMKIIKARQVSLNKALVCGLGNFGMMSRETHL